MPVHRGFTLIEMMAVVVIVAVLAAVVGMVLSGPASAARLTDVTDRLKQIDCQARDHSRRFDQPTRIVIDLDQQTVAAHRTNDDAMIGRPLRLPQDFHLERVWLSGQSRDSGPIELAFSTRGYAPSYGLLLRGPQDQRVSLMAVGMTGQFVEMKDDAQIEQTFKALADSGHDAD